MSTPPSTDNSIDVYNLNALLSIVKDNREELEWLLQRQSQLRLEYITFFKKDRSEIILSLKNQQAKEEEVSKLIMEITTIFRTDIEKSFSVVDARYQRTIQEEVIRRASEKLEEHSRSLNRSFVILASKIVKDLEEMGSQSSSVQTQTRNNLLQEVKRFLERDESAK